MLNIKPHESRLVKHLFLLQFTLGIATAFLTIGSLTLFLTSYNYNVNQFPKVFIFSALLLILFNQVYAYFEKHRNSRQLLELIVIFSGISLLVLWLGMEVFNASFWPMIVAPWSILIYMLVGYAFWGMVAIMFNIRESKRIFAIAGAGDIPAKMVGYAFVSILVPFIGVKNLLWISIAAFAASLFLIKNFKKKGIYTQEEHLTEHSAHAASHRGILERLFQNKLIFFITLLTVFASIVFTFTDFLVLSDIKVKYRNAHEIAFYIAMFFAAGRIVAIALKVLFSSRMIAKLGLANSLLLTPLLLLLINSLMIFKSNGPYFYLYIFGSMVLLMEVLKSVVQEPVFFILFQPLNPHDRLKGHLIAKGYTLPVALLLVGFFLINYQHQNEVISFRFVSAILTVVLLAWIVTVYLVKKEYVQTLVQSLKKGYFSGEDLFLNDNAVTKVLINKTKSNKPLEVIHALNLLERTDYHNKYTLLLKQFQSTEFTEVKEYILSRFIDNNMESALPIIKNQLQQYPALKPSLIKALFFLDTKDVKSWKGELASLDHKNKKAAIAGLLLREDSEADEIVKSELLNLAHSSNDDEVLLACAIITEASKGKFTETLEVLLHHPNMHVCNKAIEAAGSVKDFEIFPVVADIAEKRGADFSLQRALISYGDEIFGDDHLINQSFSEAIKPAAIKAAAKMKGDHSLNYLYSLLETKDKASDSVIQALWLKRPKINGSLEVIDQWIQTKLADVKAKSVILHALSGHWQTKLLKQAIGSEIHQDVETLLKAAALLYNRQLVDRFIEVFKLNNAQMVGNALELLELTIHQKIFVSLNELIELSIEIKRKGIETTMDNFLVDDILTDVITNSKANFNSWTRSVACYELPKMRNDGQVVTVLNSPIKDEDHLLRETKNYVLSILK